MASIIEQLNTISYTRDDFYRIRDENTFECSDNLSNKLEYIKKIIKKNADTIGSQHKSYSKSNYNSSGYSGNTNYSGNTINRSVPTKFDKSWRFVKTKVKKENMTNLEEAINKLSPVGVNS